MATGLESQLHPLVTSINIQLLMGISQCWLVNHDYQTVFFYRLQLFTDISVNMKSEINALK